MSSPTQQCPRKRLSNVTSRKDLRYAKRIVLKAGTSTIVSDSGFPCVRRIANIAEEILALRSEGKEVIFVSSGACAIGRNLLRRQDIMVSSAFDRLHRNDGAREAPSFGNNTAAAAGQANLMHLYQTIFQQLDITLASLLLTHQDFVVEDRRENLQDALENLLALGIVPVINENDTVTANRCQQTTDPFTDNDGLAALVAQYVKADLLVMLTDVDGIYDLPPSNPNARLISTFADQTVKIGGKSPVGRGGMDSKITAAQRAIHGGVPAVSVCSGRRMGVIGDLLEGKPDVGTLFVEDPTELMASEKANMESRAIMEKAAMEAREGSLKLNVLTSQERTKILYAVADALNANRDLILRANAEDLERGRASGLADQLMLRLHLTDAKIDVLIAGIRCIAESEEPIGKILSVTELDNNLVLRKETASIGVLLVIFESRPDSLPQIAALALRSGNGLLLKGGREAERSNAVLHSVIVNAVHEASNGAVPRGAINLVTNRADVYQLLKLESYIDLVIPRGSGAMVESIQKATNIPVLGHADGICHLYVHGDADVQMAVDVALDAKLNYPAACNAAETLLLNASLVQSGAAAMIVEALTKSGVQFYGGPKAIQAGLARTGAATMRMEYGDEHMTVEIVDDVDAACAHINSHGSHHTECIVTASKETADYFIRRVDSACVFHNCSTRFADGYRFGLGAEVGIATGRIHARGPVGVEGLLTQKWILRPTDNSAATVGQFQSGERTFTHVDLTDETKQAAKQ